MNYSVQLNVQLLDVDRIVRYGANKITELIEFARELRKTSSDVFIEEELADVIGRARINADVQEHFKQDVLQNTRVVPLAESPIVFSVGAGPTLKRALREQDPKYLSTVIQLLLLSRFYDDSDLSVALSRCMEKRGGPHIGATSIQGVLEACDSQANVVIWDSYVRAVEHRLQQTAANYSPGVPGLPTAFKGRSIRGMSATTILAG